MWGDISIVEGVSEKAVHLKLHFADDIVLSGNFCPGLLQSTAGHIQTLRLFQAGMTIEGSKTNAPGTEP